MVIETALDDIYNFLTTGNGLATFAYRWVVACHNLDVRGIHIRTIGINRISLLLLILAEDGYDFLQIKYP